MFEERVIDKIITAKCDNYWNWVRDTYSFLYSSIFAYIKILPYNIFVKECSAGQRDRSEGK